VEKYPGIVLAMVKMLSEILEYCNSRENWILEIEIVNKVLISDGLCINLEGGDGGLHQNNKIKCYQI
jgi:hypothetical protein